MKKLFLVLLIAGMAACTGTARKNTLTWTGDTIARSLEPDFVVLAYPVAQGGKAAEKINAAVTDLLRGGLFDPEDSLRLRDCTLAQLLDTMMAEKAADTVMRDMPYDVRSDGNVFRRGGVISVYIQKYLFTGGAHGMTDCNFLNFDEAGNLLALTDLFTDTTRLSGLNRVAFRKFLARQGVEDPAGVLFVKEDELPLPQNVGFDSTGVVMLYNQYEIAPYAFGISRYVIPYGDVVHIMKDILTEKQ